jgi:hypothetical protein
MGPLVVQEAIRDTCRKARLVRVKLAVPNFDLRLAWPRHREQTQKAVNDGFTK